MKKLPLLFLTFSLIFLGPETGISQPLFTGKFFSGNGDTTYLHLLDQAYRMTRPDPVLENLSMLYNPTWNGFVEGPTWDAWWIQNSFGPSFTLMPLMDPAYRKFVENSQELWFNQIGNGIRKDDNGYCAPVGSLCDCARPGWVIFRQGDGRHKIHDWAFGFTTAGIILQSELLLIKRDKATIDRYLPLLEQCVSFIDSRRDPVKNLFLVGTAGNLLAPSYAGSGKQLPDGTYEPAYLAEISVNFIAGLNRMIELEKMTGRTGMARKYLALKRKVESGLKWLTTDEGYFVRAREKDGTLHGQFGNDKYGYFESTPNHDAMAFRVVGDEQALKIYNKINSIPGLRPYQLIIPNFPGYDDMYEDKGLFTFGRWINGGHWTTCEARMMLGYYRVGAYRDAAESFRQILKLAPVFRLDNNLTDFGSEPYQPKLPINCVYDAWGAPGGFLRGLFEYEYLAGGMRIYPHIPDGITRLDQAFPIWFGEKKIYFRTTGTGPVSSVLINGNESKKFDAKSILLTLDPGPGEVIVSIGLGGEKAAAEGNFLQQHALPVIDPNVNITSLLPDYQPKQGSLPPMELLLRLSAFASRLTKEGLDGSYEFAHTRLIIESVRAIQERTRLKKDGQLTILPEVSQLAADQLYLDTLTKLCGGLTTLLEKNLTSGYNLERQIAGIWKEMR
ncbi:MAG: hypothetical protein WCP08_10840 [Prolixibacteraceae bacterium]